MTQSEIENRLQTIQEELLDYVKGVPEPNRLQAPEGKWNLYQQLDHLIKSIRPLSSALKKPKFALRGLFGKPNRPGRSYDALVARYLEKLEIGPPPGASASAFGPDDATLNNPEQLLPAYEVEAKKIVAVLAKWDEKSLDKYLLPHPLLGKLTVREMLYFTCYHTEHHLNLMQKYAS